MELAMSMFATQADYWRARAELAEATVHETARELGCEPDNELMLEAAHGLKAKTERLTRLLDEQGKTSCSLFDTARKNQVDAERYLWLRDGMTGDNAHRVHDETCSNLLTGPALDAAIDAAMA